MNIRKHWKKICLSAATFFWASCSSDSGVDAGGAVSLYGVVSIIDSSSETISSSDGCDENRDDKVSSSSTVTSSSNTEVSSSSEAVSSEAVSSSSGKNQYTLFADSTVSCEQKYTSTSGMWCPESKESNCDKAIRILSTDTTLTEEELNDEQDILTKCSFDYEPQPVYGVSYPSNCLNRVFNHYYYDCDNGKSYSEEKVEVEDHKIYTKEEYNQLFPKSSSSVGSSSSEESSSASGPAVTTCKHEDFYTFLELFNFIKKDVYKEVVQQLDSNDTSLSEDRKKVLESYLDREQKTLTINSPLNKDDVNYDENFKPLQDVYFSGKIVKTKTCSDGTETETDLYKEKSAQIREYIQDVINGALKKES